MLVNDDTLLCWHCWPLARVVLVLVTIIIRYTGWLIGGDLLLPGNMNVTFETYSYWKLRVLNVFFVLTEPN